jgi:hypothetical protein
VVIPDLDPTSGRLPFQGTESPYTTTLDELESRFVDRAPGEARRRLIWDAFNVWLRLARDTLPGARLWVSGSFVTDKIEPSDIDVVLVIRPEHEPVLGPMLDPRVRVLLTHLGVQAAQPAGVVEKLQPIGGLLDGFICPEHLQQNVDYWQRVWSTEFDKVTGAPTDVRMGYLEVRL